MGVIAFTYLYVLIRFWLQKNGAEEKLWKKKLIQMFVLVQVPGGMKRRVLRWYDYSWSRGRIQGGGDINTALGLLPDKLKTELALHVNLSVLKKVSDPATRSRYK